MKKHIEKTSIKNVIYNHINNNLKEYLIVTIFFFIGILLGIFFVNNSSNTQEIEITQYINYFVDSIKNGTTIDNNILLRNSIKDNLIFSFILWFVGSTVVGIPIVYGLIVFKGFSLSYTVASVIGVVGTFKGVSFSFFSMFLQSIIYIPSILALGVSGIKMYKSIIKDKRKENIKIEIYRHTMFCIIITVFLIIASFIEAYISSYLIQFYTIKFL